MGLSVRDACVGGIARLKALKPPTSTLGKMHPKLVVGIVAMDKHGVIGGASTLSEDNPHRDAPYFPISCWREPLPSEGDGFHMLQVDHNGGEW